MINRVKLNMRNLVTCIRSLLKRNYLVIKL